MLGDGDSRSDKWVVEEREREQETVDTGGPGILEVLTDMVESMSVVGGVEKVKVNFEFVPSIEEVDRRERRRSGRRITNILNKIKIATNKGRNIIRKRRNSIDNITIKSKVPRFKINIKQLKRSMRRKTRRIPPQLHIAASNSRKDNISSSVEIGE